ncbi:putative long-chain acyl-CoA synthetase [Pseudohyphozyma bogoriensis]|nr:putative long-chain acyl-CoA synthetase [Pseudohyphozyma bogoriensis]
MTPWRKAVVLGVLVLSKRGSSLSSADIASVFPSSSDLTGVATKLPDMMFSAMKDSDIIVAWPSFPAPPGAPTWIISHRIAEGHVPPTVASTAGNTSTSAYFNYVANLSTTDPASEFTVAHARITVDLSTPADLLKAPNTNTGELPTWSSESWPAFDQPAHERVPLTRRDKVLVAHVAFCLAVSAVKGEHFANSHARLGLVIFLSLSIQMAIGWRAHKTPAVVVRVTEDGRPETPTVFSALKGKSPVRIGHIAFGLGITILGWAQIRLGLEEWVTYSDSGNAVPVAVLILFWILIGVESAEVFLGRFLKEEMVHTARAMTMSPGNSRNASTLAFGSGMRRGDTEQRPGSTTTLVGGTSSKETLPASLAPASASTLRFETPDDAAASEGHVAGPEGKDRE